MGMGKIACVKLSNSEAVSGKFVRQDALNGDKPGEIFKLYLPLACTRRK